MNLEALALEGYNEWRYESPYIEHIGVDTETTGLTFYDTAFCVTIAWLDRKGQMRSAYFELAEYDSSRMVWEILDRTPVWVMHNSKFDLQKLILAGLVDRSDVGPNRIEDTEAMAHLLDEHRRKGLKTLARDVLGVETDEEEVLKKVRRELKLRKDDGYQMLPREVLIPYAVRDPELTLQLFYEFEPQLRAYEDLSSLYAMEMKLTLALLDIEANGMGVDTAYVDEQYREFNRAFVMAELDIADLVGRPVGKNVKSGEFNPGSPQQLKEYFEAEGLTVESTDKFFLASCDHPLARMLLEYRRLGKMKSTYFEALKNETVNGVLHPNFRQHGTRTGRMSSGGVEDN